MTAIEAAVWMVTMLLSAETSRELPRVLLIGDSISQGYTPYVVEMLAGEAEVERIVDPATQGNARHTRCGIERLDDWIQRRYDVVHFNWGLWDLCYRRDHDSPGTKDKVNGTLTTPLDEYRENLDSLIARLERTDAALILATTTPVPPGEPGRVEGAERDYNRVAVELAQRYGIRVDDLHAHVGDRMADFQRAPGDVHFTEEGSRHLATAVANSIRASLATGRYAALRAGLSRSKAALSSSGEARVAFLGGSITHNPGWRDRVSTYLARRFPDARIDRINAGIPSMGSTPGAFRLHRDVLSAGPVDLLFVEAAVNDSTNGRSRDEQVRAMEGIVRHALRSNPNMDVVLMHFVDPGKMASYRAGETPSVISAHESVAEKYGLPSLDLAKEVTDRIDAGEFTWEDDFRDLHPSPFGQELYYRAIRDLLAAAWRADPIARPPLGEPLDPFCYQRGQRVDVAVAESLVAFELIPSWRPSDDAGVREGFVDVPMLVAERAGASLTLHFEGSAVGLLVAAGPDAAVVEYRVDGGPPREQSLFTRWSGGLHLPFAFVLEAELDDGPHRLDLRVAERTDERSRGNAVRIAAFLTNDAPASPDDRR